MIDKDFITHSTDRAIPKKEDIWHLVKRGILVQVHYDLEMNELDTFFGQMTQFGGVVSDIGYNLLDGLHVQSQCPEYSVLSPEAAVITRTFPQDMKKGDVPHIATGKIMEFFRTAHEKIWESPHFAEADVSYTEKNKGKEETVRLFPIEAEDGSVEYVWIHDGGKYISYEVPSKDEIISKHSTTEVLTGNGEKISRDDTTRFIVTQDGQRRKKVPFGVKMSSYRGTYADDKWLWAAFHKTGYSQFFVTHLKRHHAMRVDDAKVVHRVYLWGPQGEERLKRGTGYDSEGNPVPSFSLEQLMQANAHFAMPMRGIEEGARLPDGSVYDPNEAHKNPLYDCLATLGLEKFMRRLAPDVVQHAEEIADIDKSRRFFVGKSGFEDRPMVGFGRYTWPDMTPHMGVLAHLDEAHGDRKRAVLIRVDKINPDTFHYKDKSLFDMTDDDFADMIKKQKGKPNALVEIVKMRDNPNVVPRDMALSSGAHFEETVEELKRRRRVLLQNPDLISRIMRGYTKQLTSYNRGDESPSSEPEDEIFTAVGDLLYYTGRARNGQGVCVNLEEMQQENRHGSVVTLLDVHERAFSMLEHARTVTTAIKKICENDPIEWTESEGDALSAELKRFYKKIRDQKKVLVKQLQGEGAAAKVAKIEYSVGSREEAVEYLWKLRRALLTSCIDYTGTYEVRDNYGHQVPYEDLINMSRAERVERMNPKTGDLHIEFERLNYSTQIFIDRFISAGREDMLPDAAREHYEARKMMRINGPINIDPAVHPWMSALKALHQTRRILHNIHEGSDVKAAFEKEYGKWDRYVANREEAEEILESLIGYYQNLLEKNNVTPQKCLKAGVDPGTGEYIERIEHEIDRDKVLIVDVPDRHIEKPANNEALFNQYVFARPPKGRSRAQIASHVKKGGQVVLRGAQSGRLYLAARPVIKKPPVEGGIYLENYRAARTAYADSGSDFPKKTDKMMLIGFEEVTPLANWRPVKTDLKAIKVDKEDEFMAIVSPVLGYRKEPLRGLTLRDYDFDFSPGRVRIQLMKDGHESGWELEVELTDIKKISLEKLEEQIISGEMTEKKAVSYGYAGTVDMLNKVSKMFVDQQRAPSRDDNTIVLLDFEEVDELDPKTPVTDMKQTMVYYNPAVTPRASIRREYTDFTAAQRANKVNKHRRINITAPRTGAYGVTSRRKFKAAAGNKP